MLEKIKAEFEHRIPEEVGQEINILLGL